MDSNENSINDNPSSVHDEELSNKKVRRKIVLDVDKNEQQEIIKNINAKSSISEGDKEEVKKISNVESVTACVVNEENKVEKQRKLGKKFFSRRNQNKESQQKCGDIFETKCANIASNKHKTETNCNVAVVNECIETKVEPTIEQTNLDETQHINTTVKTEIALEPTIPQDKIVDVKPLPPPETIEFNDLKHMKPEELVKVAEKYEVQNIADLNKQDMVYGILKNFSNINPANIIIGEGVLEVLPDGFGFMRSRFSNYVAGPDDIYVSPNQIKRLGLRTGDSIRGEVKAPKKNEKYFALIRIISVNDLDQSHLRRRLRFDDLTPLYPDKKLQLENEEAFLVRKDDSSRIIDMITPMGKGQRALIVAPPRTGKTVLMQNIAHAITKAHPEAYLIVLLIDERPEEVTDMARSVKGEVVSSTFDEPALRHVQLAEIVIEKAKRMVEYKKDVIILLDSITRLARAYNNVIPSSGKVLTGGVDANALQKPKRFFGAARNIEEGGSLTIIATALIETGSKMDEVIFEEFKGTGNSEIILDRKISDKRIFPAIDITKSGTRKEELLVDKSTLNKTWMLRKILTSMNSIEAIEFLKNKMKNTKNNVSFFDTMNS
jgi:transcription termination factor Rho